MVGVLLTLVAIGLVSYFVIKNYYPPIILLLLGLLLLFCAYLEGVRQLLLKLPQISLRLTLLRHLQTS